MTIDQQDGLKVAAVNDAIADIFQLHWVNYSYEVDRDDER